MDMCKILLEQTICPEDGWIIYLSMIKGGKRLSDETEVMVNLLINKVFIHTISQYFFRYISRIRDILNLNL
jgi:hypothetical protein